MQRLTCPWRIYYLAHCLSSHISLAVPHRTLASLLLGLIAVILPDPLTTYSHGLKTIPFAQSQFLDSQSLTTISCPSSLFSLSVPTPKILGPNGTNLLSNNPPPFYHRSVPELCPYFSPHRAHIQWSLTALLTFLTLSVSVTLLFILFWQNPYIVKFNLQTSCTTT